MKPKKSPQKEIERHYQNFVLVGIAIALFITLSAFKWQAIRQYQPLKSPRTFIEPVLVLSTSMAKPEPEQKKQNVIKSNSTPKRKVLSAKGKRIIKTSQSKQSSVEALSFDSSLVDNLDDLIDEPTQMKEPPLPTWKLTKMPEFPGGDAERIRFFKKNFEYPSLELQAGVGGTVVLKLLISKSGEVEKIEITSAPTQALSEEALRVAQKMPQWTPGEWNEQKVSTWVQFPLRLIAR